MIQSWEMETVCKSESQSWGSAGWVGGSAAWLGVGALLWWDSSLVGALCPGKTVPWLGVRLALPLGLPADVPTHPLLSVLAVKDTPHTGLVDPQRCSLSWLPRISTTPQLLNHFLEEPCDVPSPQGDSLFLQGRPHSSSPPASPHDLCPACPTKRDPWKGLAALWGPVSPQPVFAVTSQSLFHTAQVLLVPWILAWEVPRAAQRSKGEDQGPIQPSQK